MNSASHLPPIAPQRRLIGLYRPDVAELNVSRWRINGHSARIIIWTAEEFERLIDRPADAMYYACGVWCALRVD